MKKSVSATTKLGEFVIEHLHDDPNKLILTGNKDYPDVDIKQAALQIECRRKTRKKLRNFNNHADFLYPTSLAAEQATHQGVALFHSRLLNGATNVLDMTAGLGIDAFSIALADENNGVNVTALELDPLRAATLRHNQIVLDLQNVKIIEGDSILWLQEQTDNNSSNQPLFDLIFIDPARRNQNGRTYFFSDCVPDVVSNRNLLIKASNRTLIKASPILDITQALRELPEISKFYIVCVKGECKEVLCELSSVDTEPKIMVIDLDEDGNQISEIEFSYSERGSRKATLLSENFNVDEWNWLYDPNAGIHKADCGSILCNLYPGLKRISTDTDLYVSKEKIDGFPGRRFKIEEAADKTTGLNYDVAVRNYPLTSAQVVKKLKLNPGTDGKMMFGFRIGKKPILIKTHKE
ncbi:MAG: hypothetical protein K2M87_01110 [Muribaculaceae bacterium]|nr:hypothetical protein [Muribaculaceae bacterium]